ncbi:vacuolar protein sorting-associated protein VTA1 homolog [Stigmatopora argus]
MAAPAQLRAVQHHLRTAQEHEKRDPVVAYYCRLYAMQNGMKLDSKTPECRKFLVKLMDQLESMKMELSDNESISQEVVGNAHIENYALKLFLYADDEDRAGRFHKNMIKSFYTAGLLLDVLSVFGELSDENVQHRKYARWKAAHIHNCLKSGETPQAGPIGMEDLDQDQEADGDEGFSGLGSFRGGGGNSFREPGAHGGPPPPPAEGAPPGPRSAFSDVHVPPGAHAPANTPADAVKPVPTPRSAHAAPEAPTEASAEPALLRDRRQGDVHLSAEDFTRAQKYCKYAGSALQYEDVATAVLNLQKALVLLTTGKE